MKARDRLRATGFRAMRAALSLRRPSAQHNAAAMRARHESLDDITLREATPADIPAIASLHVSAWNDAYAPLMRGPGVAIRADQWRKAFDQPTGWFCYVLTRQDGTIVGFTKGVFRAGPGEPGELNKLFLARDYHRLGLGRRLFGATARRFFDADVLSMSAYVDPRNPSCGFFEKVGGQWLVEPNGRLNFSWYIWPDLERFR
jgi:GNAT superfamily N-acetyltransferase